MNIFTSITELFDDVFGALASPVVLIDREAVTIKANRSFLRLTANRPDQVEKVSAAFFLKDSKVFTGGAWMRREYPEIMITELADADGNSIPVQLHYKMLKGDSGEFEGGLLFFTDMREAQDAQEKMNALTIEHEALKEQLGGAAPDQAIRERKTLEQDMKKTTQFLESVVESSGDGIIIVDSAAKITRINQSFANMLGKTREELVGEVIHALGPWEGTFRSTTGEMITLDRSYIDNVLRQMEKDIFRAGNVMKANYAVFYAFHKSGDIVPLEMTTTVQKDSSGVIIRGVCFVRDITERKKAEKEIREAKEFLENVLEACGDGIFITDNHGRITMANRSFADMLGKTRQEIEGKFTWELMPLDGTFRSTTGEMITLELGSSENRMKFENRFLKHGDDVTLDKWETYALNKSNEIVPLEVTMTFQMDSRENYTGGVCSARDITERKKAEKALQKAHEFQRRFFTNITHEFRTPLTLSIGPMEGVLREEFGKINPAVKEQLSLALRNSRQLLKLVNQLLDLSRMESGAKHLVYETKDLKKFVGAILDFFSLVARKKKIDLRLVADAALPRVSIDPGKVEKVLFNLIGNAFKFTPEKGGISVSLSCGRDFNGSIEEQDGDAETAARGVTDIKGDYIKISVADTGMGIRGEDLKNIFDRFKQVRDFVPGEQAGTGIGLAHARELVEFMGGCITVRSRYGKGSTFSICLPVKIPDAGEPAAAESGPEDELYLQPDVELSDVSPEENVPAENLTGARPLVIVVDDNPDVLHYIAGILRKEYDFMTAGSGAEALKKVNRHTPDLILCDIMMPEMDGYEVMKRVKAAPGLKHIPFIFLTARADVEMKIEGLEEGADDYIVKPFNSLELLARVRAFLRIRDLIRANADQEKKIVTLTRKLQGRYGYGSIIGNSPVMQKIYGLLEALQDSDSTVLITGETGTGKELVANAIHYGSTRKNGPMVSVNCGAIPRELMEREFFGHVKGAYTGATESRKGYFQEADTGTLFLDEIGELHKDMQVKLLRVLERGEIMRVGDSAPTKVNVRLLAATNKELSAEVRKGEFREDLYYRVYVVPINIPPLRQRKEDIPLLMEHFLKRIKAKLNKELPPITEKELRVLMSYSYPGNVRELEHILERFCLLGGDINDMLKDQPRTQDRSLPDFLSDAVLASPKPLKAAVQMAKEIAEKEVILHALKDCDNNYAKTAKKLNICLASLYSKLKEYGVNR